MRPTFPPPTHAASNPVGFLPYTLSRSGTRHRDIEQVSMGPPPQVSPHPKNVDGTSAQVSKSSRPSQAHHTTASSGYSFQSRPLRVSESPFGSQEDVYSNSARTSVSPGHRQDNMQPFPTSFHAPPRRAVARSYWYDRAVSERRQAASDARDAVDRMVAERLYEKDADPDGPVKRSRSLLSRLIGCDDLTAITRVILSSPSKGLKLRNICKELELRYASLRGRSDWHVRVRYLLSQKNRFVRDDDVDEYEDDQDGETMGGTWRVDLSLKGNRLRQGVIKSPMVQAKSAATAKSSQKSGITKSSRPRNPTVESDVKRKKALQAKTHERESPGLSRTPPARPHQWYLDPPARDNPHVRLPPVSTLLDLHPL